MVMFRQVLFISYQKQKKPLKKQVIFIGEWPQCVSAGAATC